MTGPVGDADHDDPTVDASDISPSSDEFTLHRSDSASPSPTDDAVVFSVSSFGFFRFHARGGIGEVYKAGDIDLGRDVALKFIRREQEANGDCRSQFIVEGEVTARLEHPGVVPVYGLGYTTDGRPFHVMRFIQGDTLGEQIEAYHQSRDAEENASELRVEFRGLLSKFVYVCNTIAYAHNRGIVHCDIKPENIMLGKYGEALIIDWGLARPVERDERARASGEKTLRPGSGDTESDVKDGVVGTPSYMSPEQASGGDVGPASDIYSLGATFYKLLTNETPVQGSSLREILNRVQSGNFRDPRDVLSTIPSVLEAICLRAMALNVDDRYESAMDLAEDLENYLADEPVNAYREPVTTRCIRWCRRNRTLAQGIAATLLIVVVAVSSVITSSWHHRKQSVRRELEQLRTIAAAQDAMLGSEIEGLRGDVLFLASQNSVKSLLAEIENPNNLTPAEKLRFEENSRPLIRQFQEFLKHKPSYMQARLINEHGWEVVRVERDASKLSDASVVNPAQIEVSVATKLRNKSGSGYFTQRTKHDPGYVYLSQLELNEEDGVKDWHFPVIRAAVPIADDQGQRLGIVIINMHFSTLANLVQKPLETEQNMLIYLTNAEGQFLIHPVEAISFCHVRGLDFDVQTTYQLGSFFRRSSETERELPDVHPRISILLELNKDSDKELGDVIDEVEQRFPNIQSKFSRKGEDREFAVLKGVEDAEQANDIISFVQRDFRRVVKTTILPAKYHDDRQLLYSRKINFGDEKSQRSIYLVLVKPY